MPPRNPPAKSSGYQYCDHCGQTLHRTVVWRHKHEREQAAALAASVQIPSVPPPAPSTSPPLGDISITSTEQALSDLHPSDIDEDDMEAIRSAFQTPSLPSEPEEDEDLQELSVLYQSMEVEADTGDGMDVGDGTEEVDQDWAGAGDAEEEQDNELNEENGQMDGGKNLELDWNGLPGLAGDRDEDEDDVDGNVPRENANAVDEDARSWTETSSSSSARSSSPHASPIPELVRLWDLQAARNRASEGIPPTSAAWTSIKTFKLQMEVNLGANAYQKFRATFDNLELPSLKTLRKEMHDLCGLEPVLYDCCKNSCMCFVGPYSDLNSCTYCQHDRFKTDGQPFNQFHYIPLIPQIKALYAGAQSAAAMRYRSIHEFDNTLDPDNRITDIYDSVLYHELRQSNITVNDRTLPDFYFQDPRDVLLTGLTDGFQLFRHAKHTAWPVLFINNNLSPTERYQIGNCICAGLIPGPKKPKDHDSFTFIVVQELVKAAVGVEAYDAHDDEMFKLRIFCPWKCGDMPAAASAYTGGKHHGALHPCRVCPIKGIRIQESSNLNHYIPIT